MRNCTLLVDFVFGSGTLSYFSPLSFAITLSQNLSKHWKAAEIKADYSISLADCFAIATSLEHDATIITGSPEFKLVEDSIEIEWT